MPLYRHTQTGYVTLGSLFGAVMLIGIAAAFVRDQEAYAILVVAMGIAAILGVLFGTLTVEIKSGLLKIGFGPGAIRRSYRLADIKRCKVVKNPVYWGWGIIRIRNGWLYNVSGTAGVEVTLKSGKKFRIGTDEPDTLRQAIMQALR